MSRQSPLDALEASFRSLCAGPSPLALDGHEIGRPFPARTITLNELRAMLLHPSTPYAARDRAMRVLCARAAAERGAWIVGLGGVLLPGLRVALAPLARAWPSGVEDLEADAVAALVDAAGSFDASVEPVTARLVWRITSWARRRLVKEMAVAGRHADVATSIEPPRPWGHPDFVLADAVAAGIISVPDAALIGETRLGDMSLAACAEALGESAGKLRMRRMRAERRLAEWIGQRNV